MKTKLFLAAVAVSFSFAMISCTGNKTANAGDAADSTAVTTVEAAAGDACCKKDTTVVCDSTKACCNKEKACTKK